MFCHTVLWGNRGVILKHHGGVALGGRQPVDLDIADVDFPAGNLLMAGNHTQGWWFCHSRWAPADSSKSLRECQKSSLEPP